MSNIQKTTTLKSLLSQESIKTKFADVLHENSSAFTANLAVIVNNNAQLSKCEPVSIISAAIVAASLKLQLEPSLGQASIVPFGTKATFQIQYKGLKQLAIRSGQFERIEHCKTYASDSDEDILQRLKAIRKIDKSEPVTGYASYFKLLNGYESYKFMSVDEIKQHGKKYSQTFKKGFGLWVEDFEKMAIKTVVKLHLNSGEAPLSIEMSKAIKTDQAVIKSTDDDPEVEYIDNEDGKLEVETENPFSDETK